MDIDLNLQNIFVDQLGIDKSRVIDSVDIVEGLGADSLDIVELVMAVEEEHNIIISDEDAEKLKTVGDVQEYLIKVGALC